MRRPILIHPDPRLRTVCDPITEFGEDIRALKDQMLGTMYEAPGLGLAAPQIGLTKRLLVMDCAKSDEGEMPSPMCIVNPEIVSRTDETAEREEGCLSIPGTFTQIKRPAAVRVRYQDEDGVEHERDFEGLWATCVQHEMDHLDGKLFIDYLTATKRSMITQRMKRLKRDRAKG
ncbi:MAG: peptide deformylase [Pseudomonadota bacterium]